MWTIELSGAATIIEMRKKKALTVARQGLFCELDKLIFDVLCRTRLKRLDKICQNPKAEESNDPVRENW